jgi:hypothetical protein
MMERREMKNKSRFQEQAPSLVYASVLYEKSLIFGVNGVLAVSNEGKARDRRIGGWIN